MAEQKTLDIKEKALKVIERVDEALKEVPSPVSNAEKFAQDLKEQRETFQRKGLEINAQALIESDFLIRRSLLDQFLDPRRDIDKECGYPEDITPTMYHLLYERDGLCRRVVDLFPEESWANDPEVFEDEDVANVTDFEEAFSDLVKRLNLWHMMHRADALSGIGRFGILFLGFADGKDLAEPVEGIDDFGEKVGNAQQELLFLRAFDESVVRVNTRESNLANPRFGKPTMYTVTFKDLDISEQPGLGIMTTGDVMKHVHWTRVIHLADNREMSEVYGVPRMKPVFNRLMDLRKIMGGSGEMFWRGAFPGLTFELAPGLDKAEIDIESVRAEFNRYQNGLQRFLALSGMTAKTLPVQIADPASHINVQLENIAISLGIPKRVFYGSEESKLASTQDAKTWNKRVGRRQDKYITPLVIRPMIDRLIAVGVLPEPEEYEVFWEDLNTVTDQDRANIALLKTQAMAQYIQGGVDQIMPPEPYMEQVLGMDPETIKETVAAAGEHELLSVERAEIHGVGPEGVQKGTSEASHKIMEEASADQTEKP